MHWINSLLRDNHTSINLTLNAYRSLPNFLRTQRLSKDEENPKVMTTFFLGRQTDLSPPSGIHLQAEFHPNFLNIVGRRCSGSRWGSVEVPHTRICAILWKFGTVNFVGIHLQLNISNTSMNSSVGKLLGALLCWWQWRLALSGLVGEEEFAATTREQ